MRSDTGMANRQRDVDLRETQVSAPQLELWLDLAWLAVWFCSPLSMFQYLLPSYSLILELAFWNVQ